MKSQAKNPLVDMIVARMNEKKLNQSSLSELAGVVQPVISRLLGGSANIGVDNIYRILTVLNLLDKDNLIVCDIECAEPVKNLCRKVKKVVESETHWAKSLEANIHSFAAGLDNDREMVEIKKSIRGLSSTSHKRNIGKKKAM